MPKPSKPSAPAAPDHAVAPNFASVKLPAALVRLAREASLPQRRSVAGQIEYWATLGRIADETGLTVREAREAIARYDARQGAERPQDESLAAIEARFTEAEASGSLSQAVRNAVLGRQQANPRSRRAA